MFRKTFCKNCIHYRGKNSKGFFSCYAPISDKEIYHLKNHVNMALQLNGNRDECHYYKRKKWRFWAVKERVIDKTQMIGIDKNDNEIYIGYEVYFGGKKDYFYRPMAEVIKKGNKIIFKETQKGQCLNSDVEVGFPINPHCEDLEVYSFDLDFERLNSDPCVTMYFADGHKEVVCHDEDGNLLEEPFIDDEDED